MFIPQSPVNDNQSVQKTFKGLLEDNGSLNSALVFHSLQTFAPLIELIGLVDNSLDLYLARIKVSDGGGCHC